MHLSIPLTFWSCLKTPSWVIEYFCPHCTASVSHSAMALASDSPTVPRSRRGSRLCDHQMTYLAVSVRCLVLTVAVQAGLQLLCYGTVWQVTKTKTRMQGSFPSLPILASQEDRLRTQGLASHLDLWALSGGGPVPSSGFHRPYYPLPKHPRDRAWVGAWVEACQVGQHGSGEKKSTIKKFLCSHSCLSRRSVICTS